MIIGKKIRLKPTPEQEAKFFQFAGAARWAYNYFLARKEENYKEYLEIGKEADWLTHYDVRKEITALKKTEEYSWLKQISSNVIKQAVIDAGQAFDSFYAGKAKKPRFKSRKKSKLSFYVNYESLKKVFIGFQGEKLGVVKTSEPLPDLPRNVKHYSNPRISYDGKYWYLGFGYEQEAENIKLTEESIGIDLGLKELAVIYSKYSKTHNFYKNINKSKEVKRLKRKLRREERRLSRKLKANTQEKIYVKHESKFKGGYKPVYKKPLKDCKNFQKQKRKIKLIYRRLTNIRNNYMHQITTELAKSKPRKIVMEDLNVSGLMKNKHLASAINEVKWYEFIRQMQYKSERYGIEFIQVPRYYPSSKTCYRCGYVKKDLKLKDRIYICLKCGWKIDRDLNAAMNLADYNLA